MTKIIQKRCDPPTVSICIPTFDAEQPHVKLCLDAIYDHTPMWNTKAEIIVVDCERELRGYTKPQNEAVSHSNSEFIVAMNDDVIVSPDWLNYLLMPFVVTEAWCATPDQTHADGPQVFAPYCMAWRREAWEEMGGLDEQFLWWCSDIDMARCLEEKGRLPIRVKLPHPIQHQPGTTATSVNQAQLTEMAQQDLDRFRNKWGVSAEEEKYRLRDLVWSP